MKKHKALDRIDYRILELLQTNSKLTNVELAEKVHLSPPPCLERVKRLEKEGYIKQYVALLDAEKLNASLLAFIQVSLSNTANSKLESFNAEVNRLTEVQECHMVSGGFDYLLKVRVKDMADYRDFLGRKLATLPGIRETHTYVVMQEVKVDQRIALDSLSPPL